MGAAAFAEGHPRRPRQRNPHRFARSSAEVARQGRFGCDVHEGNLQATDVCGCRMQLGWQVAHPDLFSMFASPLQLVTDLAAFYEGQDVGANTRITGPLFSVSATSDVAPDIRHMFELGNPNRVFVTMGSSGEKPYLLPAIEALATMDVRAVVIVARGSVRWQRYDGLWQYLLTSS
jgi:hypothetical protein